MTKMTKIDHNKTYVGKVKSDTISSLNYTTAIGKHSSCTCPSKHHRPHLVCKHQKALKYAIKVKLAAKKLRVLFHNGRAYSAPLATSGCELYLTSVGVSDVNSRCTCKGRFYHPMNDCKHINSLTNAMNSLPKLPIASKVEYYGSI